MSRPAGTVVASEMAPTTATMKDASAAEAPRSIAARTDTGTVAPAATPKRTEGARTGHSRRRYMELLVGGDGGDGGVGTIADRLTPLRTRSPSQRVTSPAVHVTGRSTRRPWCTTRP